MRAITQVVDSISAPYTIYHVLRDREIARRPKIGAVLLFVALFAYIVSPFDIVPDVVPFWGWIDDILAFTLVMIVVGKVFPKAQLKKKQKTAEKKVRRVLFIVVASIVMAITCALSVVATLVLVMVKLIIG